MEVGLQHGKVVDCGMDRYFDASLASEPTPLDKRSRQNDTYVTAVVHIYWPKMIKKKSSYSLGVFFFKEATAQKKSEASLLSVKDL